MYGWGHNHRGQLGGVEGNKVKVPRLCESFSELNPVQIIGGEQTLFAVTQDGKVGGADGKVGGVEGKMGGADRKVDETNGKVGGADGKVGGADGKVDEADGKVGETDRRVGGTDGKMGGTDGMVGGTDGKMGGTDGMVGGADAKVGETDGKVGGAGSCCYRAIRKCHSAFFLAATTIIMFSSASFLPLSGLCLRLCRLRPAGSGRQRERLLSHGHLLPGLPGSGGEEAGRSLGREALPRGDRHRGTLFLGGGG